MIKNQKILLNSQSVKRSRSGHGYDHWKKQRLSAIALLLLYSWFIYILCIVLKDPYQAIDKVLYNPFSLVMFVMLIVTSIYHGCLGIKVVLEDYIHNEFLKNSGLIFVYFICILTTCLLIFMLIANFIINI
jgi:succinate dehydrogenase / fumarate reductase membrane anchor subunit